MSYVIRDYLKTILFISEIKYKRFYKIYNIIYVNSIAMKKLDYNFNSNFIIIYSF